MASLTLRKKFNILGIRFEIGPMLHNAKKLTSSIRILQTTNALTRNVLWSSCAAISWRETKYLYDNGQETHIFQIRIEQYNNLIL